MDKFLSERNTIAVYNTVGTHRRAHTHTHTDTQTRTHTLGKGTQKTISCALLLWTDYKATSQLFTF